MRDAQSKTSPTQASSRPIPAEVETPSPASPRGGNPSGAAANAVDPEQPTRPGWVSARRLSSAEGTVLPYEIDFENAHGHRAGPGGRRSPIRFDPNLNPSTFQLTGIAFGDTVLNDPAGTTSTTKPPSR